MNIQVFLCALSLFVYMCHVPTLWLVFWSQSLSCTLVMFTCVSSRVQVSPIPWVYKYLCVSVCVCRFSVCTLSVIPSSCLLVCLVFVSMFYLVFCFHVINIHTGTHFQPPTQSLQTYFCCSKKRSNL